jgi:hypothetical protein
MFKSIYRMSRTLSGGSTGLPVDTGTYERLDRASYFHGAQ